ncbi:thioredoxin family protein [Thalassobacillus sp. CUG 92003]|uniref:thioredoxin family protein n=1 Tax=Thalassobacillus sp. CUG 92003 TaxID=2736641 RepID=UPI0015E6E6A5|nr:thioredoxin family protein [Thalassobacillus sp. CUG 92003]
MIEIETSSFENDLREQGVALTFVYTTMCGTCQVARKMLHSIEALYDSSLFQQLNAAFYAEAMDAYKIESVPCLLITRQGHVVEKVYAFHSVPFLYEKLTPYINQKAENLR